MRALSSPRLRSYKPDAPHTGSQLTRLSAMGSRQDLSVIAFTILKNLITKVYACQGSIRQEKAGKQNTFCELSPQKSITALKSQLGANDLSADGLGQFLLELHDPGILVGRRMALDIVLDLFFQGVCPLSSLYQDNAGLDHLTADFIGGGRDAAP